MSLVVRGHSGHLIVPIIGIPALTLGAFTYYRDTLPDFCMENAEKIIGLAALLVAALCIAALFRKSRSVELRGDRLIYKSWLGTRTVPLSTLSAVTFETEVSGHAEQTTTEHYLSLWSGNKVLLRFNRDLWPAQGLRDLLARLQERAPAVQLDRAVRAAVAGG
jgi:hypothetical protein